MENVMLHDSRRRNRLTVFARIRSCLSFFSFFSFLIDTFVCFFSSAGIFTVDDEITFALTENNSE